MNNEKAEISSVIPESFLQPISDNHILNNSNLPQDYNLADIEPKKLDENTKKSFNLLYKKLSLIFAMKYVENDPYPIQVIENLYIGSIGAALSKANLQKESIECIVSLAGLKSAFPDEFTYKQFNIKDNLTQDVLTLFEESNGFIRENIQNGKKVLVHW